MRIAFVSDIHGNLTALDAVIADIERRGVDEVVNLGDTVSGPLLPLETAQRLRKLPWLHVAGNHERQVLQLPLAAGWLRLAFWPCVLWITLGKASRYALLAWGMLGLIR